MTDFNLPLFPDDMDVSDALARLRELRRSAAVLFANEEFRIVTARDIAIARYKKARWLREVPTREAVTLNEKGYVWLGQTPRVTHSVQLGRHSVRVITPRGMGIEHLHAFVRQPGFGRSIWQAAASEIDFGVASRTPASSSSTLLPDDVMSGRYDHPRIDILIPPDLRLVYAAAPPDYFCNGTPEHDFPPPEVREGDPCPRGHYAYIVTTK